MCEKAEESLAIPNAGGNSEYSEAVSISLFRLVGYYSFVLENQVKYCLHSKMIDFVSYYKTKRVGVSVTRLFGFPRCRDIPFEEVDRLLRKKLYGLVVARNCVAKCHKFVNCVLHIFTPSIDAALMAYHLFPQLTQEYDTGNKVYLLVTVTYDSSVYTNNY